MQQITLHRKGGRKPWVFVLDFTNLKYETKKYRYVLRFNLNPIGCHIYRKVKDGTALNLEKVTNKIHASHFVLGNVTITF